jgi:hypothetical protein
MPACPDVLRVQLLAVTTHVLGLGERVAAGDLSAAADVERMAGLLAAPPGIEPGHRELPGRSATERTAPTPLGAATAQRQLTARQPVGQA